MGAVSVACAVLFSLLLGREVVGLLRGQREMRLRQRDAEITRLFADPPPDMIAAMREVDAMGLYGPQLAPAARQAALPCASADRLAGVPVARRRDEARSDLAIPLGLGNYRPGFEQAAIANYMPDEPTFTSAGRTLPLPSGWRRDDALGGWHGPRGFLSDERIEFWSNGGRL